MEKDALRVIAGLRNENALLRSFNQDEEIATLRTRLLNQIQRVKRLQRDNRRFREALHFYAMPSTYAGISLTGSPVGELVEDYDDNKAPGAKARDALYEDYT